MGWAGRGATKSASVRPADAGIYSYANEESGVIRKSSIFTPLSTPGSSEAIGELSRGHLSFDHNTFDKQANMAKDMGNEKFRTPIRHATGFSVVPRPVCSQR